MTKAMPVAIAVIIFLALIAAASSAFIVDETQQVIITQFGKPVGKPILTPGIYFKIPIIQQAGWRS
jgi:membrane protease subunit HflC